MKHKQLPEKTLISLPGRFCLFETSVGVGYTEILSLLQLRNLGLRKCG